MVQLWVLKQGDQVSRIYDSPVQLENHLVVPPKEGYVKNRAESRKKSKVCPNHWQLRDFSLDIA